MLSAPLTGKKSVSCAISINQLVNQSQEEINRLGSEINQRIKYAREKSLLNQKEAARELGVSPITMNRWEAGVRTPSAESINQLAKVFKCRVEWLLTGEGEVFELESQRREPQVVKDGEACYLKGVLHLSDREVRLITAFRELDDDHQEIRVRDMELAALGVRELRERGKKGRDSEEENSKLKWNG